MITLCTLYERMRDCSRSCRRRRCRIVILVDLGTGEFRRRTAVSLVN